MDYPALGQPGVQLSHLPQGAGKRRDLGELIQADQPGPEPVVNVVVVIGDFVRQVPKSSGDLSEAMAQADTVELVKLFSSVTNKRLRREVIDHVRAMVAED